jgi:hypothetical protein
MIRNIIRYTTMPDLIVEDFKWYKDPKGYRLVPARLGKQQSLMDTSFDDIEPARIVRNGGALQMYRPLNISDLFMRFTHLAKSEDGVLKFVQTYGPLTRDGLGKGGDVAPAMIDEAENMAQALRGGNVSRLMTKFNAWIVTDQTGMRFKVSPTSLLDAIWLQFVQSKSKFRECQQCHELFMHGVGGRRDDAKFCSDQCRIKFNSLQRSRP